MGQGVTIDRDKKENHDKAVLGGAGGSPLPPGGGGVGGRMRGHPPLTQIRFQQLPQCHRTKKTNDSSILRIGRGAGGCAGILPSHKYGYSNSPNATAPAKANDSSTPVMGHEGDAQFFKRAKILSEFSKYVMDSN